MPASRQTGNLWKATNQRLRQQRRVVGRGMKSRVRHRSVTIRHRRTSVCVEDVFWDCLKEIAKSRKQHLHHLIEEIDRDRQYANLSSAIRLFVLQFYKDEFDRRRTEESKIAAQ
jgi:predicted DNA-binding ribbon-helix-helix protein